MKNLGIVFFLALAFTFVSNQAQAQSTAQPSCKKTCKKMTKAQKATNAKRNTAVLTLLGNETTEKKASCQPAQCKTPCKKGTKTAANVKLVNSEVATKKANCKATCKKTCTKNVKMTEKATTEKKEKVVLAKNEE